MLRYLLYKHFYEYLICIESFLIISIFVLLNGRSPNDILLYMIAVTCVYINILRLNKNHTMILRTDINTKQFDTFNNLIASGATLKVGDIVHIDGYNVVGDGGATTYLVTTVPTSIKLSSRGLYVIILGDVYIENFGTDNWDEALDRALVYLSEFDIASLHFNNRSYIFREFHEIETGNTINLLGYNPKFMENLSIFRNNKILSRIRLKCLATKLIFDPSDENYQFYQTFIYISYNTKVNMFHLQCINKSDDCTMIKIGNISNLIINR